MNKWVEPVCWIQGCHSYTTHVLVTTVHRPAPLEDFQQEVGYCRWDCDEMALKFVTNYDNLYSVDNIRPVQEEDFREDDNDELHRALLS